MIKLILIERDSSLYARWKSLERRKRFPDMSVVQIVSKYQGFAGEIVDFFKIEENRIDFEARLGKLLELKELGSCFLIFLISKPSVMPSFLENRAVKLGYDVGICAEEEDEVYSSIFHEVIFGAEDELAEFKNVLNEYFLFSDRATAEQYVALHAEMDAQGKPVEHEIMHVYEIWKYR